MTEQQVEIAAKDESVLLDNPTSSNSDVIGSNNVSILHFFLLRDIFKL